MGLFSKQRGAEPSTEPSAVPGSAEPGAPSSPVAGLKRLVSKKPDSELDPEAAARRHASRHKSKARKAKLGSTAT